MSINIYKNKNSNNSNIIYKSPSERKTKKNNDKNLLIDISITPKVKGNIYFFLTVKINSLTWKDANYKRKYTSYGITTSRLTVKVRLQWWGDDTSAGTIFYPFITGPNSIKPGNDIYIKNNNQGKNDIHYRKNKFYKINSSTYPICCDINELDMYFTDMKKVILDIIVDGSIMGKTIIEDLINLTKTSKPIHSTYPVYTVSPKGNVKPSIIAELDIEFILKKNRVINGILNFIKFIIFYIIYINCK